MFVFNTKRNNSDFLLLSFRCLIKVRTMYSYVCSFLHMVCISFPPFHFLHQVWMAGGLWNPLWGDLHLIVYWQRPQKGTNCFSHSQWQIAPYIAESLHPRPMYWYMLTMLFLIPSGKWKNINNTSNSPGCLLFWAHYAVSKGVRRIIIQRLSFH